MIQQPENPLARLDHFRHTATDDLAYQVLAMLEHLETLLDEHAPAWSTLALRQELGDTINAGHELLLRLD